MWNGRPRASAALVPWPTALASGSERRGIEEAPADIRGQARDVVLVTVVSQGTGPGNGAGGEHGPAIQGLVEHHIAAHEWTGLTRVRRVRMRQFLLHPVIDRRELGRRGDHLGGAGR